MDDAEISLLADELEVTTLLASTELLLTVTLMTVLVLGLVWSILKAAKYEPQAMLVLVLGVLALVSIIGYFVGGDDRAELITVAATALGALAGALTLMTTSKNGRRQAPEPEPEPEPEKVEEEPSDAGVSG